MLKEVRTLDEHDPQVGLTGPCPCHDEDSLHLKYWDTDKGPGPLLLTRHGHSDYGRPAEWCDHFYRLYDTNTSEMVYVAEPYQLYDEAFDDFVYLREQGWEVEVTAWRARHNPGHSIAVLIRRAREH